MRTIRRLGVGRGPITDAWVEGWGRVDGVGWAGLGRSGGNGGLGPVDQWGVERAQVTGRGVQGERTGFFGDWEAQFVRNIENEKIEAHNGKVRF